MCGIIGYVGEKPAAGKVVIGLSRLEPRGYDSFGLVVIDSENQSTLYKRKATENGFSEFKENMPKNISGSIGIGHTRWATHGNITDENAHPHSSFDEKIFIVHNGMLDNYETLISKYELEDFMKSQTDSEVIAHMIARNIDLGNTFQEAFEKTIKELEGSFGVAVVYVDEPDKILCAKLGSDLYIGKSNNGHFVASAKAAYHGAAHNGFSLEDGQMCMITKDDYEVWDFEGKKQTPKLEKTESDYADVERDGFKHVMLKEIMEADRVVRDSTRGRIYKDGNGMFQVKLGGLESVEDRVKDIKRIVIVGCGTAYHAGRFAKVMFEKYARIPTTVYSATEYVDNDYVVEEGTAVLAISQSGTTKDTIEAIKKAKRYGLLTLGVVNAVGSEVARLTDAGVHNHAGPEYAVASTKALTSQIVVIGLMTVFLGDRKSLKNEDRQNILRELSVLPDVISKQLKMAVYNVESITKMYKRFEHGAIIGSNIHSWVSLEDSLKLREISYTDFLGFPASELKHGNIALVDKDYLIISVMLKDTSLAKVRSNTIQVRARDGEVLVVANSEEKGVNTILYPDEGIRIFESLLANLQLQRFAYHFADSLEKLIDRPRNLAKTVTVD